MNRERFILGMVAVHGVGWALHKQSTRMVEGFGIIATENLEVAKMTWTKL
jgi:hypothetical protein